MKNALIIMPLAIIFSYGCATVEQLWETNSYTTIKTCRNQNLKISFLVFQPSSNHEEDIFTKTLIVKIKIRNFDSQKITVWLYYKETGSQERRSLPEKIPEKIFVETANGGKRLAKKDFAEVWKKVMSPLNLTFIEN